MTEPRRTIAERMADHALITAAVTRAVREAVLSRARAGHPVATSRDGKVVWLPPSEVLSLLGETGGAGDQAVKEGPAG